jgi:Putative DNA-binding domain
VQPLQKAAPPGLSGPSAQVARGLQAYRANAAALADRALRAAFGTLAQMLGDPSFTALAHAFWRAHPPMQGDMAQWGAALPGFIAAAPQLADEPSLADVARLDWALHCVGQAADAVLPPQGLQLLASADPAGLWLHLAPGTALISSAHPVATLWHCHQVNPAGLATPAERFAPLRAALVHQAAEHALVWRDGYRATVSALPEAAAAFTHAVLSGQALASCLDGAGPDFAFEPWFLAALQQGWLLAVASHPPTAGLQAPAAPATTA